VGGHQAGTGKAKYEGVHKMKEGNEGDF